MRVEDATRAVGGYPVRIYATDGGGWFPIHGTIWIDKNGPRLVYRWRRDGVGEENIEKYNLDLHDWRHDIPWSCLRDEIQWVARMRLGIWFGYRERPSCDEGAVFDGWIGPVFDSLKGIKMPTGPEDWRDAIAKRPKED